MKRSDLAGAAVLVIGGGVTGTSVANVLESFGSRISIVDENVSPESDSRFVKVEQALSGVWDLAVVSPGWRRDHPLIKNIGSSGVKLISEVDLAWQLRCEIRPSQRWLAVTGTNGKTTTVEMAAAMFQAGGLNAVACGNVGDTVIEAVVSEENFEFLIVELSSFQLQWSSLPEFVASAILNISDDHVDWHGSFAEYVQAKLRVLDNCDVAILNADDSTVVESTSHWRGRKVFFSLNPPKAGELGLVENLLVDRAFTSDPEEASVISELADVHPMAPHSVSNTLAAAALARSAGVSHSDIQRAIRGFHPGRHRIETVLEAGGVLWINDSKATNPHAAKASLRAQNSVIWIAGGLAKGASMKELVESCKGRIRAVILIGTDREVIAREFEIQSPETPIIRLDQSPDSTSTLMEQVVTEASKLAHPGDVVLLAPACASMDQFNSYADRGDQFCQAVTKLVSP